LKDGLAMFFKTSKFCLLHRQGLSIIEAIVHWLKFHFFRQTLENFVNDKKKYTPSGHVRAYLVFMMQRRNQNEAEEAMALPETNLLRFLLVLCINFQLWERRQWLALPELNSWLRYCRDDGTNIQIMHYQDILVAVRCEALYSNKNLPDTLKVNRVKRFLPSWWATYRTTFSNVTAKTCRVRDRGGGNRAISPPENFKKILQALKLFQLLGNTTSCHNLPPNKNISW